MKSAYKAAMLVSIITSASATEKMETAPIKIKVNKEESRYFSIDGGDSAKLLKNNSAVSLQTGGGISSIPVINGMSAERINIKIDGAQLSASCPNHMNPSLSYVDPNNIESIDAIAGITPVSHGGDSLGGSILVKTKMPKFIKEGEKKQTLTLNNTFKSNNDNLTNSLNYKLLGEEYSFSYSGLMDKANNYKAGNKETIKSTLYNQYNHNFIIGKKLQEGQLYFKLGYANVPRQGFVNQYMDLLENRSTNANINYQGKIAGIETDLTIYHQHVNHYMDKIMEQRVGAKYMPMYTRSNEFGINANATFTPTQQTLLKVGGETIIYKMNDFWPSADANIPPTPGMSPNTFININDGKRNRMAFYVESDTLWNSNYKTNLGVRTDIIKMNAGEVQGYNQNNNLPIDAAYFNTLNKEKTDHNYDVTFLNSLSLSDTQRLEFGYARKSRSPNLYERFTWAGLKTPGTTGAVQMDMRMINWFGDGNGYVGDINLRPEVANTLAASYIIETNDNLHFTFSPFYSLINDYIDADVINKTTTRNYLKFVNTDALIYGLNLSFKSNLFSNEKFGIIDLHTMANVTRGKRKDKTSNLYHQMPLNGKISLTHEIGKWSTLIDTTLVAKKNHVASNRLEQKTAGHAFLDIASSYRLNNRIQLKIGISNLFDKTYDLPLGGINLLSKGENVKGMGRSYNFGINWELL